MRNKKSVTKSICESRKIAMPDEINPHGTLFGGVIMAWVDKIGYMCAQNYAESRKTVTVNIDNIRFLKPVYSGEHVAMRAIVSSVGRSSMEIDVTLHKEDPITKRRELVGEAFLTFVSLSENGKPKIVPALNLESTDDFIRNRKALIRIANRKRLKCQLEEMANEIQEQGNEVKVESFCGHFRESVAGLSHAKVTISKFKKIKISKDHLTDLQNFLAQVKIFF